MDGTSVSSETRYRAEETKNRSETDSVPSDVAVDLVSKLDWSVEESFEAIRDEWLELQASAVLTPFQSLEWCETWYESSGRESGVRLRIITARDSNRLVLLFPMVLCKKVGLNCLTWIAGIWNDYNAPIVDAALFSRFSRANANAFWRKVSEVVPEADFLSLPKQPEKLSGHSNPFVLSTCRETDSAHFMSLGSDWETYHAEKWSKSTRRRLRQKRNQLERKGTANYRCADGAAERQDAVSIILQWKSDQLQARGARNPFKDKDLGAFLRSVAATSPPVLDIHLLELDGKPIAGVLALEQTRSSIIYQMCYDSAYERQSPGRLLLDDIIQQHIAEGKTVLDLSYGDEPYKAKLTEESISLQRGLLSNGFAGMIACWLEASVLHVERFVKSNPRLLKLYYAIRARQ